MKNIFVNVSVCLNAPYFSHGNVTDRPRPSSAFPEGGCNKPIQSGTNRGLEFRQQFELALRSGLLQDLWQAD